VHRSVQRATEAGLAVSKGWGDWQVVPEALLEYPNREYLLVVASALGDRCNEVVFVGGSVAGTIDHR
jgi:hypothetical protein